MGDLRRRRELDDEQVGDCIGDAKSTERFGNLHERDFNSCVSNDRWTKSHNNGREVVKNSGTYVIVRT